MHEGLERILRDGLWEMGGEMGDGGPGSVGDGPGRTYGEGV